MYICIFIFLVAILTLRKLLSSWHFSGGNHYKKHPVYTIVLIQFLKLSYINVPNCRCQWIPKHLIGFRFSRYFTLLLWNIYFSAWRDQWYRHLHTGSSKWDSNCLQVFHCVIKKVFHCCLITHCCFLTKSLLSSPGWTQTFKWLGSANILPTKRRYFVSLPPDDMAL